MKRFFALSAAVLALCVPVFAENDVNVVVNGNAVDMKGVILENRTMVPVRGVMEELGYTVDWDADTKTATLKNDVNTVKITAGESVFYLNDTAVTPDVPQTIIEGRFMLPLRAVSEAVGAKVDWDGESKTAVISTEEKGEENVVEEVTENKANTKSVYVVPSDAINVTNLDDEITDRNSSDADKKFDSDKVIDVDLG